MGIGISYTGHDGKTRHFGDSETARKFLDSLAPEAKRHTGDALRRVMQGVPSPLQGQGGKAKVMPGGSVVDTQNGLCLRGEEASPLVEGVKMFASVNGSKGFKTMAEIDPPGTAPLNGPAFGCDDKDEDASEAKPGEAARVPFVSRTKSEIGEWTKTEIGGAEVRYCEICNYEFIRENIYSPGGRWVGCTKERRRLVSKFTVYMGGGGGEYEVRPVFETVEGLPLLQRLLFGPSSSLQGDNLEEIAAKEDVVAVDLQTCPY